MLNIKVNFLLTEQTSLLLRSFLSETNIISKSTYLNIILESFINKTNKNTNSCTFRNPVNNNFKL